MNVADICITNIVCRIVVCPETNEHIKQKTKKKMEQSSLECPDSALSLTTVASFNK